MFLARIQIVGSDHTNLFLPLRDDQSNDPILVYDQTVEGEIRYVDYGESDLGRLLGTGQAYLSGRGIESSFDPRSKTVSAGIRRLKGSNLLVREDFQLKFHLDDTRKPCALVAVP